MQESLSRAVVTGGTGLIGKQLCKKLAGPVVLARDPDGARAKLVGVPDLVTLPWADDRLFPPGALDAADVVFHLAGEAVAAGRFTDERKRVVKESRVRGTRNVVASLAAVPAASRRKVLVAASATGFYGDRGDEVLTEKSARGDDFLAEVCEAWEEEAAKAESLGVRVVSARIGIVLDEAGGAIRTMKPAFKLGIAGRLASGRQWMPWIHSADVVDILLFLAQSDVCRGPINVAAPGVVTNAEFTRTYAAVLRRPAFLPVPRFALKIIYGDLADSVLASQRTDAHALTDAGYTFRYPELEPALRALDAGP